MVRKESRYRNRTELSYRPLQSRRCHNLCVRVGNVLKWARKVLFAQAVIVTRAIRFRPFARVAAALRHELVGKKSVFGGHATLLEQKLSIVSSGSCCLDGTQKISLVFGSKLQCRCKGCNETGCGGSNCGNTIPANGIQGTCIRGNQALQLLVALVLIGILWRQCNCTVLATVMNRACSNHCWTKTTAKTRMRLLLRPRIRDTETNQAISATAVEQEVAGKLA